MASFKQLFINTFLEIANLHPPYESDTALTPLEARDEFLRRLVAALFPESPEVVIPAPAEQTVEIKTVESPKKTKKTKKTKTEAPVVEAPVPEPAPVVEAPVPEPAPVVEASAETPSKKKRAPMSDEAKAAMKAKREATLAAKKAAGQPVSPAPEASVLETSGSNAAAGAGPAPETAEPVKEKKPRKPKAEKPAEDSNLAKIDPTWRKHLKHADKDHAKELEPELLKFLNALSKDDFNAKKAEEHVADFIASRVTKAVEDDGKVEADLDVVEFNGKEYYVNPETKRVYEGEGTCDEDGNWTNYKGVGYVGMAAFADMKLE